MIRITNNMPHGLNVPFPTARGQKVKTFNIPAMADGKPGVLELAELDTITMARLTRTYDHRPADEKLPSGEQIQIGLLKIEVVDGVPSRPTPSLDDAPTSMTSSSSLEPPRRTAPKATPAKAAKPSKPKRGKAAA